MIDYYLINFRSGNGIPERSSRSLWLTYLNLNGCNYKGLREPESKIKDPAETNSINTPKELLRATKSREQTKNILPEITDCADY